MPFNSQGSLSPSISQLAHWMELAKPQPVEVNPAVVGVPVAFWSHRAETDKYHNEVSIITLPDCKYRMVHHTVRGKWRQKGTIYAGRGVSIRFKEYHSDRDIEVHSLQVGGFSVGWGDGDNLGVECVYPGDHSEMIERLREIRNDESERFTIEVLCYVDQKGLWDIKEVTS